MIEEEYVQFDAAKLLKEAGFPQDDAYKAYDNEGWLSAHADECDGDYYVAPTQAQAMRWLREVHHINVRINCHFKRHKWFFDMLDIDNIYDYFVSEDYLPTYEAAAEAGIQAACKHLINKKNL